MNDLTLNPVGRTAPAHWSPLLGPETLRGLALRAAVEVSCSGALARPVAATVTGSRLRGIDTVDSDVDVLVLTAGKTDRARTLAPWIDPVTGLKVEGQRQSLDKFVANLSTSVPYTEALASPVLLADPAYAPLLRGLVPGQYTLAAHAQRFAYHAATRAQCPPAKAAKHAHAAYALAHGHSGQLDRDQVVPGSERSQLVAGWLATYAARRRVSDLARGVDRPDDLPRVEQVCDHLRFIGELPRT